MLEVTWRDHVICGRADVAARVVVLDERHDDDDGDGGGGGRGTVE